MLQGFGRVTRVDRSRRARLRRQRKRQRAATIAGGAALAIALSTSAFSDNKFVAEEEDAGTLLAARSPGERPAGALTSSKPRPRAYALPKTRVRQPDPVFPALAQLPVSALGQGALISPAALPADVAPVQLAGISNIPGVTGVPVVIARPPVAVATPAVPEPSTWAAMVLGFGAVGMMIRRGKRRTFQLLQPGQGHGG